MCYNTKVGSDPAGKQSNLGVAQLVARYLGVVEAASSSLVTQTKEKGQYKNCPFSFIYATFSVFYVAVNIPSREPPIFNFRVQL